MKGILEFNLPEEKEEYSDALNGSKFKGRIDDLYTEVFRPILKYDNPIIGEELTEEHTEVVFAIWRLVQDHFGDCLE